MTISNVPIHPKVYNVVMAAANTEYSQALPANTKKFLIKLRSTNAFLKIAFAEGESATNYINIPQGSSLNREGIEVSQLTLYFQSTLPNQVCEIETWQ